MKVIRMNIKRLQHRRDFGHGMLHMQEVPWGAVLNWDGKDGQDFEKTNDVFEAGIIDGFGHMQDYIHRKADTWANISVAAVHWDSMRILRYLVTIWEPAIIMHDDVFFTKHYTQYLELYTYARAIAEKDNTALKFVSLLYNPELAWEGEMMPLDIVPPENILNRGIPSNGTDLAYIVTPEGAEWLLAHWALPKVNPILEVAWRDFIRRGLDLSGVYTVAKPKEWIGHIDFAIMPSAIYANEACTESIRPIAQTRTED